jgi:hypothetical protein
VLTLGQRIVHEVTDEYRAKSAVSSPAPVTLTGSEGFVPFATQPTGRYYAIQATLTWTGSTVPGNMPIAGFRVLASDSEWTDIQVRLRLPIIYSSCRADIPQVPTCKRNTHSRPIAQLLDRILYVLALSIAERTDCECRRDRD